MNPSVEEVRIGNAKREVEGDASPLCKKPRCSSPDKGDGNVNSAMNPSMEEVRNAKREVEGDASPLCKKPRCSSPDKKGDGNGNSAMNPSMEDARNAKREVEGDASPLCKKPRCSSPDDKKGDGNGNSAMNPSMEEVKIRNAKRRHVSVHTFKKPTCSSPDDNKGDGNLNSCQEIQNYNRDDEDKIESELSADQGESPNNSSFNTSTDTVLIQHNPLDGGGDEPDVKEKVDEVLDAPEQFGLEDYNRDDIDDDDDYWDFERELSGDEGEGHFKIGLIGSPSYSPTSPIECGGGGRKIKIIGSPNKSSSNTSTDTELNTSTDTVLIQHNPLNGGRDEPDVTEKVGVPGSPNHSPSPSTSNDSNDQGDGATDDSDSDVIFVSVQYPKT